MNTTKTTLFISLLLFFSIRAQLFSQSPAWTLWASGLPTGVYPRMAVAPNHDIFYTLLGAGINLGYIYKANTLEDVGHFTSLPKIPRPATIQNNIVALGYNQWSEPLAGIYRTENTDPWLFRFDLATQKWDTAVSPINPSLGGHNIATAKNGTIYVGTRWAYIYKSTDDGHTFEVIDDTHAVESEYPCYYPTFNGSAYNGAIFSIQIDNNGRVYAGTETAGVIYSDDEGGHWHPADFFACLPGDSTMKDTNSPMMALSMSGNAAGLGFTKDNQLVWTGVNMWALEWKNEMGFADLDAHTVSPVEGLPDYLIQTGQQVSRIVTTDNGQMFFHSGTSNGATQIGIYTSWDGIHWSLFNDGITGQNDGQSQGSLAVDGNKVFMATHDGKVWMYEDTTLINSAKEIRQGNSAVSIFPNPASSFIELKLSKANESKVDEIKIFNCLGQPILDMPVFVEILPRIDVSGLLPSMYHLQMLNKGKVTGNSKFIKM